MKTRWPRGQFTMHAYGSRNAYVDNFAIEENIAYGQGPFLVGGGRPSRSIVVRGNMLYSIWAQVGYDAPHNEDCVVSENILFKGSLSITRYSKVTAKSNYVIDGKLKFNACKSVTEAGNLSGQPPGAPLSVLLPNKYDPKRAHLAIYNWTNQVSVDVDVSTFLKPGESVRLMAPEDFYGNPVHEMTCPGPSLRVPMNGEFAVFVALKK